MAKKTDNPADKDFSASTRGCGFLGGEAPYSLVIRFDCMVKIQDRIKRIILCDAVEEYVKKWEAKLDHRSGQAYDALLEAQGRRYGLSVNQIKSDFIPLKKKTGPRPKKR